MHLGVWLKQLKLASPNDKEGLVGMTPLHFAVLAQRVTAQGAHGAVRDRGPPWPLLGCWAALPARALPCSGAGPP